MKWLVLAAIGVSGLVLAPWILARLARRFGTDPHAVSRGYLYRFEGQDDALRKRTEKRRAEAETIRRDAVQLETCDREERWSRIHRVGGGR